jgi:hypothetical protein
MTTRNELDPAAIAASLRQVSDLRTQRVRRAFQVDYSSEALARRLRMVARMRRLCLDLAAAGRR